MTAVTVAASASADQSCPVATSTASAISPRLRALEQALRRGRTDALRAFWQEVGLEGSPLVEPAPDDGTRVLVTFLWRAEGKTHNVVVLGGASPSWDLSGNQMTRLLDTDLWYRTERMPAGVRAWYRLAPNDSLTPLTDWIERTRAFRPDPLNPRSYLVPGGPDNPVTPHDEVWSLIEPAQAPLVPSPCRRTDAAAGQVEEGWVSNSRSAGEGRRIWVYTPPGYATDADPYGMLILSDGFFYRHVIPTPSILDALHAGGRLPPLVAVLVDNRGLDARLDDLLCSPLWVDYVALDLLPWVRQRYHVTSEPARTLIGGASAGGLGAAFAGLCCPDLFGNVLSQSGSFWWAPDDDMQPEWLARQFDAAPRLALRFHLDVGSLESAGQRRATAHLRDVLRAKGYAVHYVEFEGGHIFPCWQSVLPDALIALMGATELAADAPLRYAGQCR